MVDGAGRSQRPRLTEVQVDGGGRRATAQPAGPREARTGCSRARAGQRSGLSGVGVTGGRGAATSPLEPPPRATPPRQALRPRLQAAALSKDSDPGISGTLPTPPPSFLLRLLEFAGLRDRSNRDLDQAVGLMTPVDKAQRREARGTTSHFAGLPFPRALSVLGEIENAFWPGSS